MMQTEGVVGLWWGCGVWLAMWEWCGALDGGLREEVEGGVGDGWTAELRVW